MCAAWKTGPASFLISHRRVQIQRPPSPQPALLPGVFLKCSADFVTSPDGACIVLHQFSVWFPRPQVATNVLFSIQTDAPALFWTQPLLSLLNVSAHMITCSLLPWIAL